MDDRIGRKTTENQWGDSELRVRIQTKASSQGQARGWNQAMSNEELEREIQTSPQDDEGR
jgi:hypothetical protein